MKSFDEMLRIFNSLKRQEEINLFTKKWMANLLEKAELEEYDLPETDLEPEDLDALDEAQDPYTCVDALDIDYVEIEEFKCFKLIVDEVIYTYFISPQKVLMLDNENIIED